MVDYSIITPSGGGPGRHSIPTGKGWEGRWMSEGDKCARQGISDAERGKGNKNLLDMTDRRTDDISSYLEVSWLYRVPGLLPLLGLPHE